MGVISKQTAVDLSMAYREVETAEKLLADVQEVIRNRGSVDIRDVFGRPHHGLQLGVPSGETSQRLFNVPYSLAVPVIEAHIANQRAVIASLAEKARAEMLTVATPTPIVRKDAPASEERK